MKRSILWVILIIVISVISFKAGIDFGNYQLTICDSPAKAFMAAKQLEMIDNKEYEKVKTIQQVRLTNEIVKYGRFLEHGTPSLLTPLYVWPLSNDFKSPNMKEFIESAIEYRKANPIEPHFAASQECIEEKPKSDLCKKIIELNVKYEKLLQE